MILIEVAKPKGIDIYYCEGVNKWNKPKSPEDLIISYIEEYNNKMELQEVKYIENKKFTDYFEKRV